MANQNELQIILSLVDNASAKLKEAIGGSEKDLKKVGTTGKESGDKIENSFKKSVSQFKQFRAQVTVAISVLTALVYTTREYAKYNSDARDSVNEFDKSLQKLSVNSGKALMPILWWLNKSAEGWAMISDLIANVSSGKGFVLSGVTGENKKIDDIITAKQHLQEFNELQIQNKNLYLDGKTTSDEYYQTLMTDENELQRVRSMGVQQMQELAQLTMEIGNTNLLEAERQTQEQVNLLNFYKENYMTAHAGMRAATVALSGAIKTNLGSALTDMITGAKTAKEAFMNLGQSMIQAVVDFMVQKVIAWVLEKTLLAGTVAANLTAASVLAAAWAPAALAASLATSGGNAIGALKGIAATTAGLSASMVNLGTIHVIKSMSTGGGGGFAEGTDTVPSMLSPGEMVIPRSFASAIRAGDLTLGGKGGSSFGDINISIYGADMSSSMGIERTAEMLGFEIERKLRGARSMT